LGSQFKQLGVFEEDATEDKVLLFRRAHVVVLIASRSQSLASKPRLAAVTFEALDLVRAMINKYGQWMPCVDESRHTRFRTRPGEVDVHLVSVFEPGK